MDKETEVRQAIETILSDNKAKALSYAINYCRAARFMSGDELRTQCLYILNNIHYWRHPDAKHVRETLKNFVKGDKA